MSAVITSPCATVLHNLLEKYGKERVVRLLHLFEENESGEVIAREFGVSRERVRQWRNLLGTTVTTFLPADGVAQVLGACE